MPTPSINRIQIIGTVEGLPQMKQTNNSNYLEVKIKTVDPYVSKLGAKETIEIHEVRIYGQQANFNFDMLGANDIVYVEGALRSYERRFHIRSKLTRLIAKSNEAPKASNVYPHRKI